MTQTLISYLPSKSPLEQTDQADGRVLASPHSFSKSTVNLKISNAMRETFQESIGRWTPDSRHYRSVEEPRMSSKDTINFKVDLLGH